MEKKHIIFKIIDVEHVVIPPPKQEDMTDGHVKQEAEKVKELVE